MRNDLSVYDLGVSLNVNKEAVIRNTKAFIEYPVVFGFGVGVANGLLAKARGLRFSTRATLATACVLGVGEAILAADETTEERHGRSLTQFGMLSALGVIGGLSLFTDWKLWSAGDNPQPLFPKEGAKPLPPQKTAKPILATSAVFSPPTQANV